jgi:hypothetical protein
MIELISYSVMAFAVLLLAAWLVREKPPGGKTEPEPERDLSGCLFDFRCLEMAHRIFDPADYRWLHDELCFPEAAASLARHRRELAIQWLKALRSSFKEMLRLPEAANEVRGEAELSGWQMLQLTLRFQLLLAYALLVVRWFGPYHRLVPPLGWLQAFHRHVAAGSHKAVEGAARFS